MNELDEVWSQMLDSILQNAQTSGRGDVVDYLSLKQSNDAIRQASTVWLFDTVIEIAAEASRHNPSIIIEREEPHEFPFRGGKMAGTLLSVRLGVRRITVEAGWTRTPSHGFMRGGALAAARITHFGMPKAGAELELVRSGDIPAWKFTDGSDFGSKDVVEHFNIFMDA